MEENAIAFLKLMAALCNTMETGHLSPYVVSNAQNWYNESVVLLRSIRVANFARPLNSLYKILSSGRWSERDLDNAIEASKELRNAINVSRGKLMHGTFMTSDLSQLVVPILTYLRSQTESSYKVISKKITVLNDPKLSHLFLANSENLEPIDTTPVRPYLNHVRRLTGDRAAETLNKKQLDELTADQKAKLSALSKPVNEIYKEAVRRAVLMSNKLYIPIEELRATLIRLGVPTWRLPKGLDGHILVDANGILYTRAGKKLSSAPVGGTMTMNPKYDHNLDNGHVFSGIPNVGETTQYYNTEDWVKNQRQQKKGKKRGLLEDNIDAYKDTWRNHMYRSRDPDIKLLGAMTEGLYQLQPRVGSDTQESHGSKTFGFTTWQVRHVRPQARGGVNIKYPAKSGVTIEHKFQPYDEHSTHFVNVLRDQIEGKSPTDKVWTFSNGTPVTDHLVRKYLKTNLDEGLSPHAFRHARGTALFQEMISKKPLKKNADMKEAEAYVAEMALKVGKTLGHIKTTADGKAEPTWRTAATSYINPALEAKIFTDRGLRLPKWLEKIAKVEND